MSSNSNISYSIKERYHLLTDEVVKQLNETDEILHHYFKVHTKKEIIYLAADLKADSESESDFEFDSDSENESLPQLANYLLCFQVSMAKTDPMNSVQAILAQEYSMAASNSTSGKSSSLDSTQLTSTTTPILDGVLPQQGSHEDDGIEQDEISSLTIAHSDVSDCGSDVMIIDAAKYYFSINSSVSKE